MALGHRVRCYEPAAITFMRTETCLQPRRGGEKSHIIIQFHGEIYPSLSNRYQPSPNTVLLRVASMLGLSEIENSLIEGDVVEVLKKIPDEMFDFAFTSPPYNLKNSTGNGMKNGRGGKWANAKLINGYQKHGYKYGAFLQP